MRLAGRFTNGRLSVIERPGTNAPELDLTYLVCGRAEAARRRAGWAARAASRYERIVACGAVAAGLRACSASAAELAA